MTCVLNDETLMAYVDGELPPEQEEEIRRALVDNPDAQDTVAMMRRSRNLLRKAFDPVLEEPVPQRLLDCIRASGLDAQKSAAPRLARISVFKAKPALPWAAALVLLIGGLTAYIGSQYLHSGPVGSPPMAAVDSFLDEALENTLSGAIYTQDTSGANHATREVMPRLSFSSYDKRFCREYEERTHLTGSIETRYGIACRENGHWHTVELTVLQENGSQDNVSQPGYYTPAMGEEEGNNLDALIDRLIQGPPLGPEDEARLIKNGWQAGD